MVGKVSLLRRDMASRGNGDAGVDNPEHDDAAAAFGGACGHGQLAQLVDVGVREDDDSTLRSRDAANGNRSFFDKLLDHAGATLIDVPEQESGLFDGVAVSYTHLRAHETVLDIVCRLLLDKKKIDDKDSQELLVRLSTRDT